MPSTHTVVEWCLPSNQFAPAQRDARRETLAPRYDLWDAGHLGRRPHQRQEVGWRPQPAEGTACDRLSQTRAFPPHTVWGAVWGDKGVGC